MRLVKKAALRKGWKGLSELVGGRQAEHSEYRQPGPEGTCASGSAPIIQLENFPCNLSRLRLRSVAM